MLDSVNNNAVNPLKMRGQADVSVGHGEIVRGVADGMEQAGNFQTNPDKFARRRVNKGVSACVEPNGQV